MHTMSRRHALFLGGAAALAAAAVPLPRPARAQQAPSGPFTLPPLPYGADANEPHIDAQTMQLHHGRHHAAYVTNLNNALRDHGQLAQQPIERILASLNEVPEAVRTGKLALTSRPNQDTPLMDGGRVLIGNDVWEHAYYLKYQNRRPEYLSAWWNVLNWDRVAARYAAAKAGTLAI
mgnify:CR=1 FL=1